MVEHIASMGIYEIFLEVITALHVISKNKIDHVRENGFLLTGKKTMHIVMDA